MGDGVGVGTGDDRTGGARCSLLALLFSIRRLADTQLILRLTEGIHPEGRGDE
jgi:hypothetical protein